MNHESVNESRPAENTYAPLAVTLVVLGAAARLLPHWPNFTPVGGIGLFAGSRLRRSYAWALPIAAMLISDPLLSLVYGIRAFSIMTLVVYASLSLNVWIGRCWLRRARLSAAVPVALAGSLQFFLMTNTMVWWRSTHTYPHTFAGLMACYTAALPFLLNTVAGDVLYTMVLLGGYQLLTRTAFVRQRLALAGHGG